MFRIKNLSCTIIQEKSSLPSSEDMTCWDENMEDVGHYS